MHVSYHAYSFYECIRQPQSRFMTYHAGLNTTTDARGLRHWELNWQPSGSSRQRLFLAMLNDLDNEPRENQRVCRLS